MAAKKKAKKPLAKKAMKKAKGGAGYIKFDGVGGEASVVPTDQFSLNYTKITF